MCKKEMLSENIYTFFFNSYIFMVLTIIFLYRLGSMILQFDLENSVDPRLCMKVCCGSLLCPKVELHFNIFHF